MHWLLSFHLVYYKWGLMLLWLLSLPVMSWCSTLARKACKHHVSSSALVTMQLEFFFYAQKHLIIQFFSRTDARIIVECSTPPCAPSFSVLYSKGFIWDFKIWEFSNVPSEWVCWNVHIQQCVSGCVLLCGESGMGTQAPIILNTQDKICIILPHLFNWKCI